MAAAVVRPAHRWTRLEYERVVEAGVFHPEARLELIEGEILEMSPEGPAHAAIMEAVAEELRRAFGPAFHVRMQHALICDPDSEPEPDLLVVPGRPRDYLNAHPKSAALLVEVALSSLPFDRTQKAALYARAGIPEYWIVDLTNRRLVVHRDPEAGRYVTVSNLGAGDAVTPLGAPTSTIAVMGLLP